MEDTLPELVTIFAALLTPTIAIAGVILAILGYRLQQRRRQDDLFDRRYAFYQRVRSWWLQTGNGAPPGEDPSIDETDLIPIAEEAELLFGKDIADHIMGLDHAGHMGSPFFPSSDFTKPFARYLRL